MNKTKLILMLKYFIESLYWFYKKFLSNDEAFDEIINDPRDYKLGNDWIQEQKPSKFIIKVARFVNQNVFWYKSSCTSQWTNEAANTQRKLKADDTRTSWFDMRDLMKKLWLWAEWIWAYWIDAIKLAKKLWIIDWYYRVKTNEEIKSALYKWHTVVSWSTKINWKKLHSTNYVVTESSSWSWHFYYINWWDKNFTYYKFKWVFTCPNSYWENYWDKWMFYIPFELFNKVAFNSTYAIVVNPEWSKLSREELFKKYKLKKRLD